MAQAYRSTFTALYRSREPICQSRPAVDLETYALPLSTLLVVFGCIAGEIETRKDCVSGSSFDTQFVSYCPPELVVFKGRK